MIPPAKLPDGWFGLPVCVASFCAAQAPVAERGGLHVIEAIASIYVMQYAASVGGLFPPDIGAPTGFNSC
jgi:hypothetical protein